jgi:NDP-sugar pyrophosphorylase family protein
VSRTTIQISDELRKKLKILASKRDLSYEKLLEELVNMSYSGAESGKTAVILAGGEPKKLFIKELKTYRPLVSIGKKKLIEDIILKCKGVGFDNIVIVGFMKIISELQKAIGKGEKYGAKIDYVEEKREMGSAKTLELAKNYLKNDFLFLPCDHWFDFDLKKLQDFHLAQNGTVTLGIHSRTSFDWNKGVVVLDGSRITDFEEAPKKPKTHLTSVFTGFMKMEVFNYIPRGDVFCSLQNDVFPKLAAEGKLIGYPVPGNWVNVHSNEDIEKINSIKEKSK